MLGKGHTRIYFVWPVSSTVLCNLPFYMHGTDHSIQVVMVEIRCGWTRLYYTSHILVYFVTEGCKSYL